jgi:hypothetical protein
MGVPNIALGIKLVLPQVPTRQVLVPWYEAGQSVCLCSSVSLSVSLSLFTLIHIWRGKQQMVKFQVVKIWSSSHECSYICSKLRTAPFCLRQARDCCHLSTKMPYFLLSKIVDQNSFAVFSKCFEFNQTVIIFSLGWGVAWNWEFHSILAVKLLTLKWSFWYRKSWELEEPKLPFWFRKAGWACNYCVGERKKERKLAHSPKTK